MTTTPPLDDAQQRDWRAYIETSIRLVERLDHELRRRHGLSLAEYEVLVRLSEAPDRRLRMADLAASSSYSRSRLSHCVAGLERRDLVRRERHGEDRRGVDASLTAAGFAALDTAAPDNLDLVRTLVVDAVRPADLVATGRAMRAVRRRLDAGAAASG